jgi:hypothetical protein
MMHSDLKYQAKLPWTINIHLIFFKMKGRREKKSFPTGGYQWEEVGNRKGRRRGYMVDVFCIHV